MHESFVKPRFGAQINPVHFLNRNLVGAWILNEGMGSQIGDSTWNRNAGTASNDPTWTGMRDFRFHGWGPALIFNGSNQGVQIPHKDIYDTPSAFSVELVYASAANISSLIFGVGGFGTVTDWGIGQSGTRSVFQVGGTALTTLATGPGIGNYWHIVGTYDGATMKIYDSGAFSKSTAKSGFSLSGTNDFFMGRNPSAATFYNGRVALVRYYAGRVLSDSDVQALYLKPFVGWMPSVEQRWWFLQNNFQQTFQAKANIRGTTDRTFDAKANIRNVTTRSLDAKANITSRISKTLQTKASIDIPETEVDRNLESWTINDQFSTFSRQFTLQLRSQASLKVGDQVTIAAGYDASRVQEINGAIDRIQKQTTPDAQAYTMTGRDFGARELATHRITKTWSSYPPGGQVFNVDDSHSITVWSAHGIIRDVCRFMGLIPGAIEFPDYHLFNNYVAIGKRGLDIVEDLTAPYNQFGRIKYISQVRDRVLSVIKVDWQHPPASGCHILTRGMMASQQRSQELYLDEPRLNEVQKIIIRGAAYTKPKTDLGLTLRTEYFRNTTMVEVADSVSGVISEAGDNVTVTNDSRTSKEVENEITTREQLYGDKVLNREEWHYTDSELVEHTKERFWYFEPGSLIFQNSIREDVDTLVLQSLNPSANALLLMAHTKREGLTDFNGVTQFREIFRQLTQYYYDRDQQVACEETSTQEFDTSTGTWGITKHASRIHSQTTGGAVRTHLLNFIFEDSRFKLSSADVQQVGGTRPSTNQPSARQDVITVQVQSPQGDLDANGNPIDPGEGFYTWTYENPYIGQDVADSLYQLALDEQQFQQGDGRWEFVVLELALLMPHLYVGMSVSVERDDRTFRDYWIEEVTHTFTPMAATTNLRVKRVTTEGL